MTVGWGCTEKEENKENKERGKGRGREWEREREREKRERKRKGRGRTQGRRRGRERERGEVGREGGKRTCITVSFFSFFSTFFGPSSFPRLSSIVGGGATGAIDAAVATFGMVESDFRFSPRPLPFFPLSLSFPPSLPPTFPLPLPLFLSAAPTRAAASNGLSEGANYVAMFQQFLMKELLSIYIRMYRYSEESV